MLVEKRSDSVIALFCGAGGMSLGFSRVGLRPKIAADPIVGKIDPYDLGAFALDSKVAVEYCKRVSAPSNPSKKTQRDVDPNTLVEIYPAHEFVIDLEEARALKFDIQEPDDVLDATFDEIEEPLEKVHQFVGLLS